jgi:acyl carrier protein
MPTVEDIVCQHIAENILFSSKGYPYPKDASFLENNIIDSMNVIELVMFLEEKFCIQIEDRDITPDNFDSVTRLAEYVRRKQLLAA